MHILLCLHPGLPLDLSVAEKHKSQLVAIAPQHWPPHPPHPNLPLQVRLWRLWQRGIRQRRLCHATQSFCQLQRVRGDTAARHGRCGRGQAVQRRLLRLWLLERLQRWGWRVQAPAALTWHCGQAFSMLLKRLLTCLHASCACLFIDALCGSGTFSMPIALKVRHPHSWVLGSSYCSARRLLIVRRRGSAGHPDQHWSQALQKGIGWARCSHPACEF